MTKMTERETVILATREDIIEEIYREMDIEKSKDAYGYMGKEELKELYLKIKELKQKSAK